MAAGDSAGAEEGLRLHIAAASDGDGALDDLAGLLAAQFRFDEVLELAEPWLEVEPDRHWLRFHYAKSLQGVGRYDDALEQLLTAAHDPSVAITVGGHLGFALTTEALERPGVLERWTEQARTQSPALGLPIGISVHERGDVDAGAELIRAGYTQLPMLQGVPEDQWDRFGNMKPSVLILGPAKTASSTLFSWISSHPDFVPPVRKELEFWARRGERAPDRYLDLFVPLKPEAGLITGEASVGLLHQIEAIEWMRSRCPEVRTIVLHRDPIDRAWSHERMRLVRERSRGDFQELVHEITTTFSSWKLLDPAENQDQGLPDTGNHPHDVISHGLILHGLRRWHKALGSDQVRLVRTHDLRDRPEGTLHRLHRYLGLAEDTPKDLTDRNAGRPAPLPAGTAEALAPFFEPHEAAMEQYVSEHGLDLWDPRND